VVACSAILSIAATAPAQTRHVEIGAAAGLVVIDPVYLRPLVTVGTGPSVPARAGRTLDVASPGLDAAVYAGARVQVIARWSRIPARTADARLPPLPAAAPICQPFSCIAVVVRTTEQRHHMDATLRLGSASGERAPYEASRITPTVGIGVSF
jgi:hypothetical protein